MTRKITYITCMCGKPASRPTKSSMHTGLAARDGMIFMDLARRRASGSGGCVERRHCYGSRTSLEGPGLTAAEPAEASLSRGG
jgi:hypothetical protein